MNENVQIRLGSIRCWAREDAPVLVIGSKVGSLVLTEQRLLFLSTGRSEILGRASRGLLWGGVKGQKLTDPLNFSDLENAGSLSVPIDNIAHCEAKRRWDGGAYLSLSYHDDQGRTCYRSFMTEFGIKLSTMREFATAVGLAKNISD